MSLKVRIFHTDRNCLLLVLPLAAVLFAFNLGSRDLWAPDEPRTAQVVREMVEGDRWAVPHNNGRPYLDKPPLYFWIAATFASPPGRVDEFNVRLPSSLAALLTVLCVFYLGRTLFGRRTGVLAAIVLATTHKFFMEARWAHTDMLWTLFLTLACLAFVRAYQSGGATRWLLIFYLSMGFAVLTKGPLGLILPLASALVFLAASRDLSFLRRAGLVWGLALALAPGVAWLIAYRFQAGEAFPLGVSIETILERFTVGLHHRKSPFYILVSFPVVFIPWVFYLPGAVWLTFPRKQARADRETVYLYTWITVLFTVFAFSMEKRGVYLLPLLPLLSVLVGRFWDTALLDWDPAPLDRVIRLSQGAAVLLATAGVGIYLPRLQSVAEDLYTRSITLAGLVMLTALVPILVHRRFGGGASLTAFAAGVALCLLLIAGTVLPALNEYKSARAFGSRVASVVGSARLCIYPLYREAYAYYTGRSLEVLESREELNDFFSIGTPGYCIMERHQYETESLAIGLDLEAVDSDEIGHRSMVLVRLR